MGQVCVEDVTYTRSDGMDLSRLLNSRMLQLRHDLSTSVSPNSAFSQDRRPPPIRRNLFGPVNHQQCLKFAQDEMEKMVQADSRRWNFDFNTFKPKEGFYSWQHVQGSDVVPEACDVPDLTCSTSQATTCLTTSTSTTQTSTPPSQVSLQTTTSNSKTVKRLQTKLPQQRFTKKLCTDYFSEVKSTSRQVDRSKLVLSSDRIGSSATYVNAKLSEIVKVRSAK